MTTTTPPSPDDTTVPPIKPAPLRTNMLAVVALVSSFFVGLAGIVCGAISLSQMKRTGERGRGLAIAGIVVGGVQIVLSVVVTIVILGAVAVSAAASSASHYSKIPDFVTRGETAGQCADLGSTITGWNASVDPTIMALDPAAGLKKLAELRDELARAGDTIIDRHLSEVVDTAVEQLDELIAVAEPYNEAPETMGPEALAMISKKLELTMQALKEIATVCTNG